MSVNLISAEDLYHQLLSNDELALIDVREIKPHSHGHLLFAIPLPLARLELMVADLIPCKNCLVVVCDGGESDAENPELGLRAACRLTELGYTQVAVLEGGSRGWQDAGYELFDGVNVPSKAFGEFVKEQETTPSISAEALKKRQESGEDIILLDSRPEEEFQMLSVPGGICCPGAELAYRVHEVVPSPETTVVVNCAGRTRSIVGCQSLINAGIPNKVYALRNGVMGWHLAGHEVAHGCTEKVPAPNPQALAKAKQSAVEVAARFAVQTIDRDTLNQWRTERESRSLYVLDVRTQEEFEASRLPDAVHTPGGQLVQNTDIYIGTRNARLVLVDSEQVRAIFTASWLIQMGRNNVYVLEDGWQRDAVVSGVRTRSIPGLDDRHCDFIAADALKRLQETDTRLQILDVSLSDQYEQQHIDAAWFVPRARLASALKNIPAADLLVLTSSDGISARLAAAELEAVVDTLVNVPVKVPVKVLAQGNKGWAEAGYPLESGKGQKSLIPDDQWQIPFLPDPDTGKSAEQNMREYLSWEVELAHKIKRDGTTDFRYFPVK